MVGGTGETVLEAASSTAQFAPMSYIHMYCSFNTAAQLHYIICSIAERHGVRHLIWLTLVFGVVCTYVRHALVCN